MIARYARLLLLAQAFVAGGLFLLLRTSGTIAHGWLAALAALALVMLLRLLVTANNFILARHFGSNVPPAHRIGIAQAARLFITEFIATMVTSSWSMPFRACTRHREPPVPQAGCLPVLLVHGYACNSGYWTRMSDALLKAGITHRALDLEPMQASIEDYVPQLQAGIDALCRDSGQSRIIIVAHSMGGLAARALLRRHGASRLAGVITLGTPHHGSSLARFAPGRNCSQMRRRGRGPDGIPSDWLRALAAQEEAAMRARVVSIYSHHDNIIAPQDSSHLPGATNIEFHGIGHVALGRDRRIIARVIDEVRRMSLRG